ncbi:MAG TPA: prepilin-type N-terminal cleavage/methylation domain-containing protein [Burkholderiales bacterium]|jgi:prepilin-type N-terminal cleavage/methylation domain-containing protein|nr:prepilin-type N-terminal cleavage/methylation domain-containing protein [Burkholderiales bacterium]
MKHRQQGFTLIEMAVAVFIIALLLGSILVPLTTQVEQRQISDAQKAMEEIKEALVGFAITRGYLPCPDRVNAAASTGPNDLLPNDGIEDFNPAGNCITTEGNVPWVTLGIVNADPWGNRFRYRVAQNFAQHLTPFTLSTMSTTIDVCTTVVPVPPGACGGRLTTSGDGPPALIMSHGKNGYLAISAGTGAANPCPAGGCSPDEIANGDGIGNSFVSRPHAPSGAVAGEFDDIVTWLSKNILINRMVTAGKLP